MYGKNELQPFCFLMKNTPTCISCTGSLTLRPLLLSKYIGKDILEDESSIDVTSSLAFTNACSFPSETAMLKVYEYESSVP